MGQVSPSAGSHSNTSRNTASRGPRTSSRHRRHSAAHTPLTRPAATKELPAALTIKSRSTTPSATRAPCTLASSSTHSRWTCMRSTEPAWSRTQSTTSLGFPLLFAALTGRSGPVSRSCSLHSRAAQALSPAPVRCTHGPLRPCLPLLFAALTGRSGPVSRSCSLHSRAAQALSPAPVRCTHGPLRPCLPLLFAALTGRSGPVSRSCSLHSRAAQALSPAPVRCTHGPLRPCLPLLFAALTGRSGPGPRSPPCRILVNCGIFARPLGLNPSPGRTRRLRLWWAAPAPRAAAAGCPGAAGAPSTPC